jgi:hypothetical protein
MDQNQTRSKLGWLISRPDFELSASRCFSAVLRLSAVAAEYNNAYTAHIFSHLNYLKPSSILPYQRLSLARFE